eukprot:10814754-Heterocapsa_arctica.AAC.1
MSEAPVTQSCAIRQLRTKYQEDAEVGEEAGEDSKEAIQIDTEQLEALDFGQEQLDASGIPDERQFNSIRNTSKPS